VDKNLPGDTGVTGSIPGLGRVHMSRSNQARVPQPLKPINLEPVLRNKRSHRREKLVHPSQEQPPFDGTREIPQAATKTVRSQKQMNAATYVTPVKPPL